MKQFWSDYWWLMGGVICALAFLFARLHQRATGRAASAVEPRSFAAIRAFSPHELVPYFGVYRAGWAEWLSYAYLVIFFAAMGYMVTASTTNSDSLAFVVAALCFVIAAVAAWIEAASLRIIGPQNIGFASPLQWLSWSLPLRDVQQCDLVPGRPPKLRIISSAGARSLTLTRQMWVLLRNAAA